MIELRLWSEIAGNCSLKEGTHCLLQPLPLSVHHYCSAGCWWLQVCGGVHEGEFDALLPAAQLH